jgi:hypothetical protein
VHICTGLAQNKSTQAVCDVKRVCIGEVREKARVGEDLADCVVESGTEGFAPPQDDLPLGGVDDLCLKERNSVLGKYFKGGNQLVNGKRSGEQEYLHFCHGSIDLLAPTTGNKLLIEKSNVTSGVSDMRRQFCTTSSWEGKEPPMMRETRHPVTQSFTILIIVGMSTVALCDSCRSMVLNNSWPKCSSAFSTASLPRTSVGEMAIRPSEEGPPGCLDVPAAAGPLPLDVPVVAGPLPLDVPVAAGPLPLDVPVAAGPLPLDVPVAAGPLPLGFLLAAGPLLLDLPAVALAGPLDISASAGPSDVSAATGRLDMDSWEGTMKGGGPRDEDEGSE